MSKSTNGAMHLLANSSLEGLTQKQRMFVIHYAASSNAVRAAEQAGYGGSYGTLRSIASENLTKPNIREAVNSLLADSVMSETEALARLSDEARSDIGDFFDADESGYIRLNLHEAKAKGLSHLLKRVKTKNATTTDKEGNETHRQEIEFEMYDAQAAKDKILRALGMYGAPGSVNVNIQNNQNVNPDDYFKDM